MLDSNKSGIFAIVVVDKNWNIGCEGGLLFDLKKDMAFFKEKTMNKMVIMGRKTLESIPGGKGLPHRKNVVISSNLTEAPSDNIVICSSVERAYDIALNEVERGEQVFVVGGGSIYKKMLPYCDGAYVTKVDAIHEAADTSFPDLDLDSSFILADSSDPLTDGKYQIQFTYYERKHDENIR